MTFFKFRFWTKQKYYYDINNGPILLPFAQLFFIQSQTHVETIFNFFRNGDNFSSPSRICSNQQTFEEEDYQHDDHKSFLIEEYLKRSFKLLEQSESENDSTYYGNSIFPEKTSVGKQKSSISFISKTSIKI